MARALVADSAQNPVPVIVLLPLFVSLIFETTPKFVPVITSCLPNASDPPAATIFGDTEVNVAVFVVVVVVVDDDEVVDVFVVDVVEVPWVTWNPFLNWWDCPSGFFTRTSQYPTAASEGMTKLHVMRFDDENVIVDALTYELPETKDMAVPVWKPVPFRLVIATVVPVFPVSGSTLITRGPGAEVVVTVAVAEVVLVV